MSSQVQQEETGEDIGSLAGGLAASTQTSGYSRRPIEDFDRSLRPPKSRVKRWFARLLFIIKRLSLWRAGTSLAVDDDCLLVFYDLGHWPITYDPAWVVVAADLIRRDKGLAGLHFVFVPAEDWEGGSEGKDYFSVVDGEARRQRVHDMLVPMVWFLPTTRGYTMASSRKAASKMAVLAGERRFPTDYVPENPKRKGGWLFPKLVFDCARAGLETPTLTAPPAAQAWVRRWQDGYCDGRPYVTITLRYFGFTPERNSNLEAWAAFARELEQRGYRAVIVPDTHMTLDPLPSCLEGLHVFAEAAWHIHLRLALYETAYLNLSVNTGPMTLCWLSKRCRYLIFKHAVEGDNVGSLQAQLRRGIDPRKPLPIATPYQRLVLDPDDLDVIRREFDAMEALIEADAEQRACS